MPKTKKSNKAEVVTPKSSSNWVSISVKSLVAKLFPEECNICNKIRIKSKERGETSDKIAALSAERTIKESAKQKDPELPL